MRTVRVVGLFAVVAGLACGEAKTSETRLPESVTKRPAEPLFEGESAAPKPDIRYDPQTGIVTVKMAVEDPSGRFLPNIRRDNFAVYDNGIRQKDPDIEIEHAPVTLAVVMQWGGRSQALNEEMDDEIPRAAHQLLDELGKRDKIAIWTYGDRTQQIADFSKGHDALDEIFLNLNAPEFSEANLYDALVSTLDRMRTVTGRKALVLISTGIDTFSKASYQDVLNAARACGTPVYIINVGPALRSTLDQFSQGPGPYARLNWNLAQQHLREIAGVSGGRLYSPNSTFDLSAVYDDMMENLRVRYVIQYKSPSADSDIPRTVRIELVNPQTGGPLEILDASGKPAPAKVSVQATYVPRAAAVAHAADSASRAAQE